MESLNFKTAFKYPFNRAKGMLNILWVLLPIFGWFALGGYGIRIIQEFIKGEFEKLPVMSFGSDMKLGFFMFLKSLPFMIPYMIIFAILEWISPWLQILRILVAIFVVPMLSIHFAKKMNVGAWFEFKILKSVFNNLGDYIVTLLKAILLGIIFLVMWIVLVGIPAGAFTQQIFLADFYRRNIK